MKKRMLLLSMCLMLAVIPGCGKSGKQQSGGWRLTDHTQQVLGL